VIPEIHMERFAVALLVVLALAPLSDAVAAQTWVEGRDYVPLTPAQHTSVPAGKVEVMEVFSYGCPGCNSFEPVMSRLRHSLPPNAQVVLLPASFHAEEDWPMFQRAYFAAQSLGIAERTHQGIFDAVWKTGELAVSDPATHQFKNPQPSLQDAARCYARIAGVKPGVFLAAANSFAVDMKMRAADEQIIAMQVPSTPCIVVNGRYRVNMDVRGSAEELIDLVRFLVARESKH
jgi:thiol:disulfide interchange protein DsbA